jgi:AcrR family transcriptional regulator
VTPPTPYHHGDVARAAVAAASALVHEHGTEAVTIRAVATAVGVSHAALYRHFANRADLLDAVAASWLERLVARAAEATSLRQFVATYASAATADPQLYRCAFSLAGTPEARRSADQLVALRRQAARVYAATTGAEGDALRDGVMVLWGTVHGLLDLYWRGLVRARTAADASRYVADVAVATVPS